MLKFEKGMPPKTAKRLKRYQEKMKNKQPKQPKQYRLQARKRSAEREEQKEAAKAYDKVLRDMERYAKSKEKAGLSDQV